MRVVASWIAAHYQSLHAHTHPGGFDIGTFHHLRTGRRAHAHVGVQGSVDHGCGYLRRGHHHQISGMFSGELARLHVAGERMGLGILEHLRVTMSICERKKK